LSAGKRTKVSLGIKIDKIEKEKKEGGETKREQTQKRKTTF